MPNSDKDIFQRQLQLAVTAIRESDALMITAGAGMGVDSGLPDFRGNDGFWNAYPPFRKLGLSFYDLADPKWFDANPRQAWGFYGHRLNLYKNTKPHAGFDLLLKWASAKPAGYFVFTSNVDGHFQQKGFDPKRVVECHGSFSYLQCHKPCSSDLWSADTLVVSVDESTMLADDPIPVCRNCGKTSRPNILMFSDWNWVEKAQAVQLQRYGQWISTITENQKISVIEIGAGTAVPSVRNESERRTRSRKNSLVRINVRESEGPSGSISLAGPGLKVLQDIDRWI